MGSPAEQNLSATLSSSPILPGSRPGHRAHMYCGTKGHYEKVCMKKSAHLVDVSDSSNDSEPLYYDELGEPVYAQMYAVQVNARNRNQHLIQLPISVNLEKVRKQTESCPTIPLKIDTGADVNLLNSTTFDLVNGNRSILQSLITRNGELWQFQDSSAWKILCILWDLQGRSTDNPSLWQLPTHDPDLLSRDACYALGVVKPCYAVEADRSNLHADLKANLQGSNMADLRTNLQNVMDLQSNWPQIHTIKASYRSPDEKHGQRSSRWWSIHPKQRLPVVDHRQKLQLQTQWSTEGSTIHYRLPDEKYRQRSRHSTTQNTAQIYQSIGKSTRNFRSTTESMRSFRIYKISRIYNTICNQIYTKWLAKQGNSLQWPIQLTNTVDSISHAYFRSNFQTDRTEIVERKQIQGRGIHNSHHYKQQMKDPVLQSDLQSNLQADLQEDLQADLQMDLQVKTGLEGTLQPSSLVSFQAETSTEERSTSTSMGGTCKQGPNHVSGELPQICKDLHPTWICKDLHPTQICKDQHPTQICKDLHPTWICKDLHPKQIYKTRHFTGSTPKHPAIPNGNPVTPPLV